jgi:hypothetical protein
MVLEIYSAVSDQADRAVQNPTATPSFTSDCSIGTGVPPTLRSIRWNP